MTTRKLIALPGESTEELIGNFGATVIAQRIVWQKLSAVMAAAEPHDEIWQSYIKMTDRIVAMQLEITDRMRDEKRDRIDTGRVQATLEYDTVLRGRYLAVMRRDGKVL